MTSLNKFKAFITIALSLFFTVANASLPSGAKSLIELRKDEFSNIAVSPSGKYISAIMRTDDRNTLVILDRKTGKPIKGKSVRYEEKDNMEVVGGEWLSDDIYQYDVTFERGDYSPFYTGDIFLLYMNKKINQRIWSYRGNYMKGRKGDKIFGNLNVISKLPKDAGHILVSISPYKRQDGGVRPVIYKMELSSGDFDKITIGPGRAASIIANYDGSILGAAVPKANLEADFYFYNRQDENPQWKSVSINFPGKFAPERFTNDGKFVYGMTQLENKVNANRQLIKLDINTGSYEVFHDFGFVSQINVEYDKNTGEPTAVTWVDDGPKIKIFKNDPVAKILAGFYKSFPGYLVSLTGADKNQENITLHVGSPGIRGEYYIWEKNDGGARYLFSQQEKIDALNLNSYQSINYTASDGIKMQGWLLMPRSGNPKALVNYIHGGPHGPYVGFWFDWRMQAMAEMGYAVFAPNFRGSGGYGNNFERAGYTKWGTRMLDDMREGAEFVMENFDVGERVYTLGGSYGGYSSAQNVIRHNDFYDCSVVMAGFFEFDELTSTWDGRRGYMTSDYTDTAMGTDKEKLKEMSPIHNVEKIKVPMLITHGKADRRTPLAGAKKFVSALEKTDVDFEHFFYGKEGHGLYFDKNSMDQFQKIEEFLTKCDKRKPLNKRS